MTFNKKKVLIAAVPLLLGISIFAVLQGLLSHRSDSSGPTDPNAGAELKQFVTTNPEHERAELQEELKKKPGHPPILLRLAEIERDSGHPDKAVTHLRQVLDSDANNQDALLELGRMLYQTGDVDGAIAQTKHLLEVNPKQVDGLYNMGAIYANIGRSDLARQYWNQAVAAGPDSDSGRMAKDGLLKLAVPGAAGSGR